MSAIARRFRQAIKDTISFHTSEFGRTLDPRYFFLPAPHRKALRFDVSLVLGNRGSGKSTLFSALLSDVHKRVSGLSGYSAVLGFGERSTLDRLDRTLLHSLLKNYPAETIWRAVIAHASWHVADFGSNWEERVTFVRDNPEEVQRRFSAQDEFMQFVGRRKVVLFDALDRTADRWDEMQTLLVGLLKATLYFLSFESIRTKLFVRPDLLAHPDVRAFPDASKVLSNRVILSWEIETLYSLLWQRLGNSESHGAWFREQSGEIWESVADVFQVPDALKQRTVQERLFELLTGPAMGTSTTAGKPYAWLFNHLCDSHKAVSPRSFLQAVTAAAESTEELFPEWPFALHPDALKTGIRRASQIRIEELEENYPWIPRVMAPLQGLGLPCPVDEIFGLWELAAPLDAHELQAQGIINLDALMDQLVELGICSKLRDDRINFPDIYRLGFGFKRKGGLIPKLRQENP